MMECYPGRNYHDFLLGALGFHNDILGVPDFHLLSLQTAVLLCKWTYTALKKKTHNQIYKMIRFRVSCVSPYGFSILYILTIIILHVPS
ncbi:hypothetical protein K450DRAFT_238863 [Umbelopsis ramanniana AG]|uniref:Uncharacterized protein n=1 Tax=Umbelopsis ramanniana AG TaxID=1314678 RepID=A0AAD5ED01_UMBRA|nr:uncharacterized protein K450DRAFT_238863 [Umbelopsis ramanniana AG]KAI8580000.1 hypothetical protein K450DRAFT_238863 [Umbelopsis ramanniana AG]